MRALLVPLLVMAAVGCGPAYVRGPVQPLRLPVLLRDHYPAGETAEGEARVNLVVEANGTTSRHRIMEASSDAFGWACVDMLRASEWEPAQDADGEAVPARITFRCVFEAPRD
jgi:hypothetical protein